MSSGKGRPRVHLLTHRVIKFKYFFVPTLWIEHSNFIASCPHHPFLAILPFPLIQGSHWNGYSNIRFRLHFQHVGARILAPKQYNNKNAEVLITWLQWFDAFGCMMLPPKILSRISRWILRQGMLCAVGPPHWNLNIAKNRRVGSGLPSGNDDFTASVKARWLGQGWPTWESANIDIPARVIVLSTSVSLSSNPVSLNRWLWLQISL